MKFRPTNSHPIAVNNGRAGFTLAEALAALAFLAIVIPVAVEGLRVASQAGQVANRKAIAARVADRVLNELIVTKQWQQSSSGTAFEGQQSYPWRLVNEAWQQGNLKLVTLQVTYAVQGQNYDLRLSTVLDPTQL